jgi:hypothetical protein
LPIDTGDVDPEVLAPSGMPRKLDVALNELALPLPAHVERNVVSRATSEEEHAKHGGS